MRSLSEASGVSSHWTPGGCGFALALCKLHSVVIAVPSLPQWMSLHRPQINAPAIRPSLPLKPSPWPPAWRSSAAQRVPSQQSSSPSWFGTFPELILGIIEIRQHFFTLSASSGTTRLTNASTSARILACDRNETDHYQVCVMIAICEYCELIVSVKLSDVDHSLSSCIHV